MLSWKDFLWKKKGISPDALKSSAQLRLHGESGKFCLMFCQFCLLPWAATSVLFVCGGGSVCKLVIGCSSYNVGMLTPDKHSSLVFAAALESLQSDFSFHKPNMDKMCLSESFQMFLQGLLNIWCYKSASESEKGCRGVKEKPTFWWQRRVFFRFDQYVSWASCLPLLCLSAAVSFKPLD